VKSELIACGKELNPTFNAHWNVPWDSSFSLINSLSRGKKIEAQWWRSIFNEDVKYLSL